MNDRELWLASQNSLPSEALMRAFDIKGDLPGMIDGLMQLGITIEDLTQPEFLWLRRKIMFQARVSMLASAANFSLALLFGRAFSVMTVQRVIISNRNAGIASYVIFPVNTLLAGLTLVTRGVARDDRAGTSSSAAELYSRQTAVDAQPLTAGSIQVFVPATSTVAVEGPWVLTGQQGNVTQFAKLAVQSEVINSALEVSFVWTERFGSATEGVEQRP